LLPLVCAADLNTANEVLQKNRICWSYACCAAEREQAPSPQVISRLFCAGRKRSQPSAAPTWECVPV